MTDLVFVDTDVLVYARDAGYPQKQEQAARWMTHLWHNRTGWFRRYSAGSAALRADTS